MIRISNTELKWLKGFNGVELDKYLIDYPQRKETTLEFKRRYKWVAGQWRKK